MNQSNEQVGTKKHYGDPALHQRIQQLIRESDDPQFTGFLNQLGNALWNGKISDSAATVELEKNYAIYRSRMRDQDDTMEKPSVIPNAKSSPGNKVEFAVGAGVLGVTGAVFLLIAFVIFAMNFMNGLVKGICLYAISLAVIVIAEFIVNRKQEKFALGMTGVGFAGLFLSTIINYGYFSVINSAVALGLIVLITAADFWLCYKKDSGILRIIALLGSIICLLPMVPYGGSVEFIVTGVLVLVIQTGAAFIPSQKDQRVTWVLQICLVCASILLWNGRGVHLKIDKEWLAIFTVLMVTLLNLLFLQAGAYAGSIVAFCVTYANALCFLPIFALEGWKLYGLLLLPLAGVTVLFTLLNKHAVCRWIPYWFFHGILWYCLVAGGTEQLYTWSSMACVMVVFVLAKILNGFPVLRYSECIITLAVFFYQLGMTTKNCGTEMNRAIMLLVLTVTVLLSSLRIRWWHVFYEVLITLSAVVCAVKLCPGVVRLPVVTGIFILGIFLVGILKTQLKQNSKIYAIFSLCCLAICYLWLGFTDNIYIYIIMLLFGVTAVTLLFDEKYGLSSNRKYLWMGIYLTYMFLILDAGNPVINSVLLTGTAILCVTLGFATKQASARIYGLVLAVVAALKVVLFDFIGRNAMQRMLAFLVVGVLILVISYIYIRLEKKLSQEELGEEKEECR